jgi:glycosyltransferase involved in cell wall biosynthesis
VKIVILGTAYPLRGGLAAFNERLAQGLMDEGHEVELYTFSLQYPNFLFPGSSQYAEDTTPPQHLNIKVIVNSINPLNWLMVGLKLKKLKPDLIICKFWLPFMGPCFGSILRLAKLNKHTKVISIIDNIIPHEKRFGDKLFAQYFAKSIDAFVAMSRSVAADLKHFTTAQQPIQYLAHPVYDHYGQAIDKNEAKAHLKLNPNDQYLLFFGIIRPYKGLDFLLEAFAMAKLPENVKLIIAGEYYTDSAPYLAQIKKHQLENKVLLHTHFIPDAEVKYYFCAADIVAQPYHSATQSGISQICYHFDKPMLVTNVGGLPEIVPHNIAGYVVEPQAANIAQALETFYNHHQEAQLSNGVKSLKHRFTWTYFIENMLNMLK